MFPMFEGYLDTNLHVFRCLHVVVDRVPFLNLREAEPFGIFVAWEL